MGLFLASPAAVWLLVFFVAPLAILAAWSFQQPGLSFRWRWAFTLDTYRLNAGIASYRTILWKTVAMAAIVATVAVAMAYPIAYLLARVSGRRRYLLLGLALVPSLTSYLLRIFAWRVLLGAEGVINSLLQAVRLVDRPLDLLLFSRPAVVIVLIYVWVPWAALPIFVRLEQLDEQVFEAARDLGAAGRQVFRRVTLPLSMPGIYAAFFFVFIPTLGDFATASAVGGADGVMFGNLIQKLLTTLRYSSGAALSMVLLVVAMTCLVLAVRFAKLRQLGDAGLR